jgi:hypothetical protein
VLAKPGGERGCFSVCEQVDGPVGGHVHQDGAVLAAAAEREVVDTKHRHLVDLGSGSARSRRSNVVRLVGSPRPHASRAPALPANASPIAVNILASSALRRA